MRRNASISAMPFHPNPKLPAKAHTFLAFRRQRLAHSLSDATPFLADQNNNSQVLLNEPRLFTFIVTVTFQSLFDINALRARIG